MVQAIHQQTLMLKIKDLVYAKSEQQLAERFNQILKDNTAVIYPQFIKHVNNYWPRRHKWAICFQQHLLIRGNQTNNYAEAGIKILKEIVFSRVKAYNLIEMVSFVTDTMDLYYQHRLLHLANNRIDRYISLRYCGMTSCTIPKETITQDKVPNIFLFRVTSLVETFTLSICTLVFVPVLVELMDLPAHIKQQFPSTTITFLVIAFQRCFPQKRESWL